MSIVEGILLLSLGINAYTLWRTTKAEHDIEMLYQGTAICMDKLGISQE